MAVTLVEGSAFQDVDASGEAARLAAYLRTVRVATEAHQAPAERRLGALGLRPGMRVLDVGCGLGDDVLELARAVGPGGRAAGLDASREFLARALERARSEDVAADFVLGDAHALPFADDTFDAVRTERTLQHVADPAAAVREMARVTRPGGVVTASEPDWGTLVIDLAPAEVTQRVLRAFRAGLRHATIGRQLVRLFAAAGLRDVRVEPSSVLFARALEAAMLLMLPEAVRRATADGLPARDGARWLAELQRRGDEGTFFAAATGFLVIGTAS